jgi:hypothetical protein
MYNCSAVQDPTSMKEPQGAESLRVELKKPGRMQQHLLGLHKQTLFVSPPQSILIKETASDAVKYSRG